MRVVCHACGEANELLQRPLRRDECSHCGQELHCCLQCRFYDEAMDCREPQAQTEAPREKDRANFCEYFQTGDFSAKGTSEADRAKAAFDALFKTK